MKYIYFDNNATTKVTDEVKKEMVKYIQQCGNPSGNSFLSVAAKNIIISTQKLVNRLCNLRDSYHIIFTSGASESNSTMLHMVVDSWWRARAGNSKSDSKPHIISSEIEHTSTLSCLKNLQDANMAEVTLVAPSREKATLGIIDARSISDAIKPNTVLVSIMYANNEIGTINAIKQIAKVSHQKSVPFHTDAVQMFGKKAIDLPFMGIDALSMSFHKINGPAGLGMLLIRKAFATGYNLKASISGTQQYGLRGGTENVPAIAGAAKALQYTFSRRDIKNARLLKLKRLLISLLQKKLPIIGISDAETFAKNKKKAIVLIGPSNSKSIPYVLSEDKLLPSTILLSVIDKDFCNVKFKKYLESKKIIVSIGSACNTKSSKASHVLEAIKAPPVVKRGILRISFGDENTSDEVKQFAKVFLNYCL